MSRQQPPQTCTERSTPCSTRTTLSVGEGAFALQIASLLISKANVPADPIDPLVTAQGPTVMSCAWSTRTLQTCHRPGDTVTGTPSIDAGRCIHRCRNGGGSIPHAQCNTTLISFLFVRSKTEILMLFSLDSDLLGARCFSNTFLS
jgi:hypothetical protein